MRALTLALLATLTFAAPAGAAIVPQQSIAGVKLGMTTAQVRAKLGKPKRVTYPKSEILGRYKLYDYGLTEVAIHTQGNGGTVFSVDTRSKAQKTSKGVGVGSTRQEVAAKVAGAKCSVSYGFRSCTVGSFTPGKRVTTFRLSTSDIVTSVSLGFVID